MIQEAPISAPVKQQEITIQEPQKEASLSYVEPLPYVPLNYKNTDTLVYFHRLYKDLTEAFEYINYGYQHGLFKEKHLKELKNWKESAYSFYDRIRQNYMDARDKDVNFNLTEQQKFGREDTLNNIIDSMPLAAKEDKIHWSMQNRYELDKSEKIAYYIDLLESLKRKGNYAKRDIDNISDKINELEQRKTKGPIIKKKLATLYKELEYAQKIEPAITTDLEYQKRYLEQRIKDFQQQKMNEQQREKEMEERRKNRISLEQSFKNALIEKIEWIKRKLIETPGDKVKDKLLTASIPVKHIMKHFMLDMDDYIDNMYRQREYREKMEKLKDELLNADNTEINDIMDAIYKLLLRDRSIYGSGRIKKRKNRYL